jgi:PAS domain S-box-containing protein
MQKMSTGEPKTSSTEQSKVDLLEAITRKITLGASLEDTFGLIYDRLREFVPYNRIAVALADPQGEKLSILAARSDGKVVLGKGYTGAIAGSSLEPLMREGSIRVINDLQEYLAKKPSSDSTRLIVREGMKSSLTLPLLMDAKPVGVMFFSSRNAGAYRPEHEEFLKNIVGHMAIAVERARLVDSLRDRTEYLENVLQNSHDAIILLDPQNRIRTWNEGARRILGYTSDKIIGASVDQLMVEGDRGGSLALRMQASSESRTRMECDLQTNRGERRVVEVSVSPLQDKNGRFLGLSCIARDITGVKALQEELVRTHGLAVVGEMAATVAHEIKNPLAGISGAIQVLAEGMPKEDNRRAVIGEILDQVWRLDRTVRDLLNFARPITPVVQSLDLVDSLAGAWKMLASQSEAKSIRFTLEPRHPVEISGDPQLLRQVWVNLFQNAIEAMPKGGEVAVVVGSGDAIRVEIRDAGSGIEPSMVDKIWRPFFTTKTRGTGLGLPLVKKIVEAHRGRIWCESVPSVKTSFFVEIPK